MSKRKEVGLFMQSVIKGMILTRDSTDLFAPSGLFL
jgi:hypothetical protein